MKIKTKIISIAVSMCLLIAVMVVGVFAATTVTQNNTSTITFTAQKNTYVTVSGVAKLGTDEIGTQLAATKNYTSLTEESSGTLTAWAIGDVDMGDGSKDLTYVLTIKNDGATDITVTLTPPSTITNLTIGNSGLTTTITAGQTGTITITISVDNVNTAITSAACNFGISIAPSTP